MLDNIYLITRWMKECISESMKTGMNNWSFAALLTDWSRILNNENDCYIDSYYIATKYFQARRWSPCIEYFLTIVSKVNMTFKTKYFYILPLPPLHHPLYDIRFHFLSKPQVSAKSTIFFWTNKCGYSRKRTQPKYFFFFLLSAVDFYNLHLHFLYVLNVMFLK